MPKLSNINQAGFGKPTQAQSSHLPLEANPNQQKAIQGIAHGNPNIVPQQPSPLQQQMRVNPYRPSMPQMPPSMIQGIFGNAPMQQPQPLPQLQRPQGVPLQQIPQQRPRLV